MPAMCGTVRDTPKFTPDAISMMLFGPGVIEQTIAKVNRAASRVGVM